MEKFLLLSCSPILPFIKKKKNFVKCFRATHFQDTIGLFFCSKNCNVSFWSNHLDKFWKYKLYFEIKNNFWLLFIYKFIYSFILHLEVDIVRVVYKYKSSQVYSNLFLLTHKLTKAIVNMGATRANTDQCVFKKSHCDSSLVRQEPKQVWQDLRRAQHYSGLLFAIAFMPLMSQPISEGFPTFLQRIFLLWVIGYILTAFKSAKTKIAFLIIGEILPLL